MSEIVLSTLAASSTESLAYIKSLPKEVTDPLGSKSTITASAGPVIVSQINRQSLLGSYTGAATTEVTVRLPSKFPYSLEACYLHLTLNAAPVAPALWASYPGANLINKYLVSQSSELMDVKSYIGQFITLTDDLTQEEVQQYLDCFGGIAPAASNDGLFHFIIDIPMFFGRLMSKSQPLPLFALASDVMLNLTLNPLSALTDTGAGAFAPGSLVGLDFCMVCTHTSPEYKSQIMREITSGTYKYMYSNCITFPSQIPIASGALTSIDLKFVGDSLVSSFYFLNHSSAAGSVANRFILTPIESAELFINGTSLLQGAARKEELEYMSILFGTSAGVTGVPGSSDPCVFNIAAIGRNADIAHHEEFVGAIACERLTSLNVRLLQASGVPCTIDVVALSPAVLLLDASGNLRRYK